MDAVSRQGDAKRAYWLKGWNAAAESDPRYTITAKGRAMLEESK